MRSQPRHAHQPRPFRTRQAVNDLDILLGVAAELLVLVMLTIALLTP